jgi:hypothetical protein
LVSSIADVGIFANICKGRALDGSAANRVPLTVDT